MTVNSGIDPKYYSYAKTDAEDVLKELNSSHNGLSSSDVKERLNKYG